MNRSDFRFLDRLRVRWAEVDAQHIVFNGHYLMYFDTAVAGWWRALALPYHETMHAFAGDMFVRKATLEYEASARYDEVLDVGIRCGRIGNSSLAFQAAVFRGEKRLVHGELLYVFADPATQTSRPVPQPLRELFVGFESGQPVLDVRLGRWHALGDTARALRRRVFVDELALDAALVDDDLDEEALHAVAFNRLGLPVAAARLTAAARGVGQVGRLVTLASLRGSGIAGQVLARLVEAARERGEQALVVHAAPQAVALYRRAGFEATGESFAEAGREHVTLRRRV